MKHSDDIEPSPGDLPFGAGATGHWTRADFVAALPLHVGGDLEDEDAVRVQAWLAAHPEDQGELDAAFAARSVLVEHARSFEHRATPDLWPGIREELARVSATESAGDGPGRGGDVAAASAEPTAPLAGGYVPAGAAILRGPSRWYERPGLAAAAALFLVGTVAIGLVGAGRGNGSSAVSGTGTSAGGGDTFARAESVGVGGAAIAGTAARPLEVTPVSAPRGARLQRTGGNAEHLVNTAEPVLPFRRPQKFELAGRNAAQLTGGR